MLRHKLPPALWLICLLCSSPYTSAETFDDLLTEDDLFGPVNQIQSVTGLKQRLSETPAATTIIDQALIKASGAVHIVDLLRFVPGFQVYHVNANKFGVVSHGQGSSHPGRLEVMIDGRSVYLPLLSTVDWSALGITLDDIDYIEVVRGSNVPSQGSNAFLGSINIVTKEPFKRAQRQIKVTLGSEGWAQSQFQTSGRFADVDYGISGDLLHNNGFGIGYNNKDTDKSDPFDFNDGADLGQLSFRGSYTPSLTDSLDFSLGFSQGGIAVGTAHSANNYGDRDFRSNYQSIKWQRILNSDTELQIHAYHNYLNYDNTLFLDVAEDTLGFSHPAFSADVGIEDGTSERYDLSAQLSRQLNLKNRFVVTAGVRHESIESDILFGQNHNKVDEIFYRLSSHLEHSFNEQWVLNLGAMLEDNDLSGTHLSPRLGINYKLNDAHSFRGILSHAYRTPSLLNANEELTYYLPDIPSFGPYAGATIDLVTRPYADLKAEKVQSAELGYNWQSTDQHNSFDLRIFYEEITKGIDSIVINTLSASEDPLNQQVREYRNEAFWTTHGFEVQFRTQPTAQSWLQFSYGYADAQGHFPHSINNSDDLGNATSYVPQHTIAAIWSQQLSPAANLSLAWYSLSQHRWHSADPMPAYNRIDMRYAHSFTALGSNTEIEFIVQNLFDDYTEFDVNNEMGTQAFIRLSTDF